MSQVTAKRDDATGTGDSVQRFCVWGEDGPNTMTMSPHRDTVVTIKRLASLTGDVCEVTITRVKS